MTPEEVQKYHNKTISIKAPGRGSGYRNVKIVDYDLDVKTIWGKGVVYLKDQDNFWKHLISPYLKAALSQVELYEGPVKRRTRKSNSNNNIEPVRTHKKKNNETTEVRRRKRKSTIRKRRRKNG